jgi:hypothetical protein
VMPRHFLRDDDLAPAAQKALLAWLPGHTS